MFSQLKNINFWIVLGVDVLLLAAAHLLAYIIRFDNQLSPLEWGYIRTVLPGLILLKVLIFFIFGLYRGMWRYTGIVDLFHIVKACVVAFLAATALLLIAFRFEGLSRSVFILDTLLTFLLISGHRIILRLFYQRSNRFLFSIGRMGKAEKRRKLLILGAGDAAEKVVREIHDNPQLPYTVVGFLDDHPGKIGKRIHGILVMAAIDDLPEVAAKTLPDEILIAIPSADREQMNRIVELCQPLGIPYKTLPGMGEIIDGRVSIKAIRDVSYKDLLGRPPVRLELPKIDEVLHDRTVLVTGAGGSIGSELCRQILRFHPARLILLDASEENLYRIEMEILHERGWQGYVPILGKVQNRTLLEHVFARYRPAVVFHAAAYKHVPLVENNPWEAVFNNIIATRTLLDAALRFGVDRFLLVSTDKAVRPTNVMGASKRITERLMQAYCHRAGVLRAPTRFMAVRFGNVLGSSGSVVPLFRRQIELGGPVTVTHPEVTRYFMSIEEAAQLILQATAMGAGGEIFILKMGTPVKIAEMAREVIRLCGKEPDTEIEIKYIGLRPGEKLYEELITEGENIVPTEHEGIMVLRGEECSMDAIEGLLDNLSHSAEKFDPEGIRRDLLALVPEYHTERPV
ncbi:MAG: nucleoside-diphosphate sugar epimerase/dehydratase [Thermodesulfobacteriota bacterium]